jgi:hypothetical protein
MGTGKVANDRYLPACMAFMNMVVICIVLRALHYLI